MFIKSIIILFREYTPINANIDTCLLDVNVNIVNPPSMNKSLKLTFVSVNIKNVNSIVRIINASIESINTIGRCSDILAVVFPLSSLIICV